MIKEEHDTGDISETSYVCNTEGTFKQRLYAHKSDLKELTAEIKQH